MIGAFQSPERQSSDNFLRLGLGALGDGRIAAVEGALRRSLALAPDSAGAWAALASAITGDGAVAAALRACLLAPHRPVGHEAVCRTGPSAEARAIAAAALRLVALAPGRGRGWVFLAGAALRRDGPLKAAGYVARGIESADDARELCAFARELAGQLRDRESDDALAALRTLAAALPSDRRISDALDAALCWSDPQAAISRLETRAGDEPDDPGVWWLLFQARFLGGAAGDDAAARRAAALRPGWSDPNAGLAHRFAERLKNAEASIAHLAASLGREPRPERARLYLSRIHYVAEDGEALVGTYRRAREAWGFGAPSGRSYENIAMPRRTQARRRLRVGYLGSTFGDHVVSRNVGPILEHHDAERFEVFCYRDGRASPTDSLSDRWARHRWRSVEGLDDTELACVVRDDALDVLVVLAAHFDRGRPSVFSHRMAPVQATYHDAWGSGLANSDVIIADRVLAPPSFGHWMSERIVRLPVYTTFYRDPDCDADRRGDGRDGIRIAAFANPYKISRRTLRLWARAMATVPGAVLVVRHRETFACPVARRHMETRMADCGIDLDRVCFGSGSADHRCFLEAHRDVDLMMDTTPFSGMHTNFTALWMGVPVVTLAGGTMMSRQSAALLSAIGRQEWVAETEDAFAAIVARLAGSPAARAADRRALRPSVRRALCDGALFTRRLEDLYAALLRTGPSPRGPSRRR